MAINEKGEGKGGKRGERWEVGERRAKG